MRQKLFSLHCFTHFPKTTAPQHVAFSGKLSTIIIFKLCKFSVNLWTLCFLSYKSYMDTLKNKTQGKLTVYVSNDLWLNYDKFTSPIIMIMQVAWLSLPSCIANLGAGLILHRGNEGDCLRCPWPLPWCPWNAPVEIYNFLIGCPLPKEKMLWCPCLFQKGSIQACGCDPLIHSSQWF